ncbi:MAG: type II toxin-antitoxin system VapC family toxin [Aggregatilineales bacterium]
MTSSTPTTIEPLDVVDSHALIWYLTGDKKLSKTALMIFRAAERGETRLLLPVIVLAELYYANVKNKWFDDYKSVYQELLSKRFFKFLPLDHRHILEFDRDAAVPEMHDRIIAGVARRLRIGLVSSDPLITAAAVIKVVW